MIGPKPRGHWTSDLGAPKSNLLKVGQRYAVVTAFTDYDGGRHTPGESWTFLAQSFSPYEDGLSLFVSIDGISEWLIRLQWLPETQGKIIDHLSDYLQPE